RHPESRVVEPVVARWLADELANAQTVETIDHGVDGFAVGAGLKGGFENPAIVIARETHLAVGAELQVQRAHFKKRDLENRIALQFIQAERNASGEIVM